VGTVKILENIAMPRTEVGGVIKKTTFTELLPPDSPENLKDKWKNYPGGKKPPFWTYWDALSADQRGEHLIYLKRYQGDAGSKPASCNPGKFEGPDLATGISLNGNPPMLFGIDFLTRYYGGGIFKLMVKDEVRELIYDFDEPIEGKPKDPLAEPLTPTPTHGATGETAILAQILAQQNAMFERLFSHLSGGSGGANLVLEGARSAMTIQAEGLRAATTAMATSQPAAMVTQSPEARMMEMMKMFTAMKTLFSPPATNAVQETLQLIGALKGAGLVGGNETGGGKGNTWIELIKAGPSILHEANQFLSTLGPAQAAQVAAARRAEESAHALNAGTPAPQAPTGATRPNPQPAQPAKPNGAEPVNVTPVTPVAPSAPAPGGQITAEQMEQAELLFLHRDVANVLTSEPLLEVEDAVERVLVILEAKDVELPSQLAALGESGLTMMFNQPPYLTLVPKGERLNAFLKLFVAKVAQVQAEIGNAPVTPTKPN
jgi:hypothetical protein